MSAVYLEPYCCNAAGAEKDSGYDSLRRRMSVLDRLSQTHSVWLQLSLSEEEARHILLKQPPGVKKKKHHNDTYFNIYLCTYYYR